MRDINQNAMLDHALQQYLFRKRQKDRKDIEAIVGGLIALIGLFAGSCIIAGALTLIFNHFSFWGWMLIVAAWFIGMQMVANAIKTALGR